MTFAQRLRHHRLANGITLKQAAAAAGVVTQTLGRWESGRTKPDLTRAGAIASALGVPVAALFTDELVVAEVVVSAETVERIRQEGREAAAEVATRLAAQLEPAIYAAATRPARDTRPGARAKPRQSRAERIASLKAYKKPSKPRSIQ